ncbi:integrase [Sinorhizobium garamanticum]|uniref:Integrase n=1 Tax=Sinorhizobium garamanticum TaxID=680247 RepID=A0ABY8DGE1_9HYPH|nr:integrase [Sinorhizobium garamanticum]WEX89939.1 integrase [Sinorhizobium garamanticum]
MGNRKAPGANSQAVLRRAEELDALDAILPFDRRDQLAALLTDDDVATLKHLASEGMGENTLRALASDLGYLEAWCQLATGVPLPWPAPESLLLKFVAHHLWDPVKRAEDPAHGMPADVEAGLRVERLLRASGPHAPGTVRRRLTTWSILTRWRGLTGDFGAPSLKSALRLAVKASSRPRQRKSKKAVTGDVLATLLQACAGQRLVDRRDRALLLTAFASGGRRSEVAALRVEDLTDEEPVRADPNDKNSPPLPCLSIRLGRTKTTTADDNEHVLLDPALFSAHGLRSGYLTEAANRDIPLPEAMQQSLHKSVAQAASYYNNAERTNGRAARLIV